MKNHVPRLARRSWRAVHGPFPDLRPLQHWLRRDLGGTLQKLALPAGDLVGMHVILRGKLCHGLLAPQGFQGYAGLERRGMVSSGSSHRICSFHIGNIQQSVHLSPRPKNPNHLFVATIRPHAVVSDRGNTRLMPRWYGVLFYA
jgi:hypothetical protein